MSDEKFLFTGPCVHRDLEEPAQFDFDLRYRHAGRMAGTTDKNVNDGRSHAKTELRLDIGRIIEHMQQSRPEMPGVIGIDAGKQAEPSQVYDTDQQ